MKKNKKKWEKPIIKDYLLGLKDTAKHNTPTAESAFPVAQQPFHGAAS